MARAAATRASLSCRRAVTRRDVYRFRTRRATTGGRPVHPDRFVRATDVNESVTIYYYDHFGFFVRAHVFTRIRKYHRHVSGETRNLFRPLDRCARINMRCARRSWYATQTRTGGQCNTVTPPSNMGRPRKFCRALPETAGFERAIRQHCCVFVPWFETYRRNSVLVCRGRTELLEPCAPARQLPSCTRAYRVMRRNVLSRTARIQNGDRTRSERVKKSKR